MPSIACLRPDGRVEWAYHFVLVIPGAVRDDAEVAALEATEHLVDAFEGGAVPETVALRLRSAGYVSVTHFRVVGGGSRHGEGFVPGVSECD